MNYAEALAYVAQHTSYETTGHLNSPTTERIERLMSAMGDPHLSYPVIHITGTNGKGSVAQIITQLLIAQGLKVGTYTSPHLERINERFTVNGEQISDDEFADAVSAVADLEVVVGVRPTFFETTTSVAFRYFADVAVDVAVIEVGLLGRWDATNIVQPVVSVVTNVGLDHTDLAGPTVADVAREKAGIVKPGSVLVLGETDPELSTIFRAEGPIATFERSIDFDCVGNELALGGRLLDLRTPSSLYSDVFLPLYGRHQGDNAAVALCAVEAFFGAPLAEDVVTEGFSQVQWPGRFEVLGHQPLVIIDGAHNPLGADRCAEVFFDDFDPVGRRILVCGFLREKDPEEMLSALRADEFDLVYCTTAPTPRGLPAADVAAAARAIGCEDVLAMDEIDRVCSAAVRQAGPEDAVLVTGSLYVIGAARPALLRSIT